MLGLAVIIAAVIVTFFALPYLVPFFASLLPFMAGAALVVIAFIAVAIAVYVIAMLGVVVQYLFKPVQVSKQAKGYGIARVSEAGLREKGGTGPVKRKGRKKR